MNDHDVFWRLEGLSDRQLLERLGFALGSSRRLMAELIAHLGEVEERRLHLISACSSMFTYCLKLGMTEDEAYRRIEVARLARFYPAIFPLLADGQLTISAVVLLKHHLSRENHLELLGAAAGKTVAQTRELIAARFPRPDVASSARKLPERRTGTQPSFDMSTPTEPRTRGTDPRADGKDPCADRTQPSAGGTARTGRSRARAERSRARAGCSRARAERSQVRTRQRRARARRGRLTRSARRQRASSRSPPSVTRSNSRPAPSSRASSGSPRT